MRGKHAQNIPSHAGDRITPADAGKTKRYLIFCRLVRGSPPRMRGKHRCRRMNRQASGITPAGAGKTTECRRLHRSGRDHPRRCGENARSTSSMPQALGSPPQVRGKPGSGNNCFYMGGITPAGAGKTCNFNRPCIAFKDHPRRCGENRYPVSGFSGFSGSPPQVRGKRPHVQTMRERPGITPAGAGKTCLEVSDMDCKEDHPRRCGENRLRCSGQCK